MQLAKRELIYRNKEDSKQFSYYALIKLIFNAKLKNVSDTTLRERG